MGEESKTLHLLSLCTTDKVGTLHSKWLSENVQGVNQSVKLMLEIIEQVEDSSAEKSEIYFQKHPELISLVQEIIQKHQFLAEQYDHLALELHGNVSSALQMQKPGSAVYHTCQGNSFLTPDQKLTMHKIERQAFDIHVSSGGSSSNGSAKEGSESSLSLSSGSDSKSFDSSPQNPSNSKSKISEQMLSKLETATNISKVRKDLEYGGEFRILKENLQFSEEEIARFKDEIELKTSADMDNLKAMLERTVAELKVREDDLELEKRKVLELQMQIGRLEAKVMESGSKIETLVKELKLTTEMLDISKGELSKLKLDFSNEISQSTLQLQSELQSSKRDTALLNANLASEKMQILKLQERIIGYTADVSDRDCEIRKLSTELQETLRNCEVEKTQLQSDNCSFLEKLTLLEARCAEREVQIKLLENEIKKSEASKMEMKAICEAKEIRWQEDAEVLKAQLNEKGAEVESLNKSYDGLKLKYDMLMAEKDGLIAKVQTLKAVLCSRDIRIQQLEAELHQLNITAASESSFKLRDDLRIKVEELEKEVERQAALVSDRAEEKREAIRQLCFSLEHYRSGYQELREAYIGQRRHAIAS